MTIATAQHVYEWLLARGWGRCAIEYRPRANGRESYMLLGIAHDDVPPWLLCDVRGPVAGIVEEIVALEQRAPEWCEQVKSLLQTAHRRMMEGG